MMKYDSTEPLKLETGAEGVAGVTGRSGGAVRGAGPPGVFPPDGSRRQGDYPAVVRFGLVEPAEASSGEVSRAAWMGPGGRPLPSRSGAAAVQLPPPQASPPSHERPFGQPGNLFLLPISAVCKVLAARGALPVSRAPQNIDRLEPVFGGGPPAADAGLLTAGYPAG